MNVNIRKEFNNVFGNKVNEEFCYIPKDEFISFFKTKISDLINNDFCFNFKTSGNDEEYQFLGDLKNIKITENNIVFSGVFEETCAEDNKKNELIMPIDKINRDIRIKFHPQPWMGQIMRQDFPKTTNIMFSNVEEGKYENIVKQFEATFYFCLKDIFSNLIEGKNIVRKIQFVSESNVVSFFDKIKNELIDKEFSYWTNGKDVKTPILEAKLIKEERYEEMKSLLVIKTQYGIEEIYLDCMNEIQESDNYLHFDQRKWNGSEYSVKI